jgi:hypothetical protein
MAALEKTYLYRMTHIGNVAHILRHGITNKGSSAANPGYIPIGDSSLITSRSSLVLNNGRSLGDYIPFYFGTRTPMLYVIQKGFNGVVPTPAEEIVYCVSSVQKIIDLNQPFVFTDGHAIDSFSSQYAEADVQQLGTLIDWEAVNAMDWKKDTDLDLKRRKQAEFLVLGDIPREAVLGFIVYNEEAKHRLRLLEVLENQIHMSTKYYF